MVGAQLVVTMPRGYGKTETLLRSASIQEGIYVCADKSRVKYAIDLCVAKNIKVPEMMTIKEIDHMDGREGNLFIDEIFICLNELLGLSNIEVISY